MLLSILLLTLFVDISISDVLCNGDYDCYQYCTYPQCGYCHETNHEQGVPVCGCTDCFTSTTGCGEDTCGFNNSLCSNPVYLDLMCNLCPSSCGLCLVCQDLPYVSPKTYNCTGAEITFEDSIPVEYCLHKTPMSFDEAEKFCQQDEVWIDYQGHLASISDALTNAVFLQELRRHNLNELWLGSLSFPNPFGNSGYTFFEWLDGLSIRYSNFQVNQNATFSSLHYLYMKSDGKWYVEPATTMSKRAFICVPPVLQQNYTST